MVVFKTNDMRISGETSYWVKALIHSHICYVVNHFIN